MHVTNAPKPLDLKSPAMVLRTTLTSPFGRKVRLAAESLCLTSRIDIVPADTLAADDSLRQQNPLGKMPCLLLADGTVLFDSGVIIEYLASLTGNTSLLPASGIERYRALTNAKLCDGITEAALLMVYEHRFREPAQISQRWLDHQHGKITRALRHLDMHLPDANRTTLGSIGLACALSYLDWRKPVEWRGAYPDLADWLRQFAKSEPAFLATAHTEEII